jgi:hypothetical protein
MYRDICVLVSIEDEERGQGRGFFRGCTFFFGYFDPHWDSGMANHGKVLQVSTGIRIISAVVSFDSAIRNNTALGQSLYMVANPPLPNAASYICKQIGSISFGCPNQAHLPSQIDN